MTKYLTTDPNSPFQLEIGKRYFADFDISQVPMVVQTAAPFDSIKWHFIAEMRDRGHEMENVTIKMADGLQRVSFTVTNAPPVWLIIAAIIVAIGLAYGLGAAGASFMALFVGIGEALKTIAEIPEVIVNSVVQNPWAVIGIVVAVGIFITGARVLK